MRSATSDESMIHIRIVCWPAQAGRRRMRVRRGSNKRYQQKSCGNRGVSEMSESGSQSSALWYLWVLGAVSNSKLKKISSRLILMRRTNYATSVLIH